MGRLIAAPALGVAAEDTDPPQTSPSPQQQPVKTEASRKEQVIARLAPTPEQRELQENRLSICEVCPHFKRVRRNEQLGQARVKCAKCGCQGLELWIEGRKCPDGRWDVETLAAPAGSRPGRPFQTPAKSTLTFKTPAGDTKLANLYAGWPAFLMLSGPSLATMDLSRLKQPGILTMGVNNSPKVFRPNLWTHVDLVGRFVRSIFLDPTITKFVPTGHMKDRVFDSDSWEWTQLRAMDCPNVMGVKLTTGFDADNWLTSKTVVYGNDSNSGGARTVMLVAIRLLYELGVRDIYLLGADFRMSKDYAYAFDQNRKRGAVVNNNRTYRVLKERFAQLKPHFAAAGLRIWNATPGSQLDSFPMIDFDDAVDRSLDFFGHIDVKAERTEGLYDRQKPEIHVDINGSAPIASMPDEPIDGVPGKVQVVTVSVGYGETLGLCLDAVKPIASSMTVVTDPDDSLTIEVAEKRGAKVITSTAYRHHGINFDKGRMLNLAIRGLDPHDWILAIDSDCVLHPSFVASFDARRLDQRKLYGCAPREVGRAGFDKWASGKPGAGYPKWRLLSRSPLGAFQLFHIDGSEGVLKHDPCYPENMTNGSDGRFMRYFRKQKDGRCAMLAIDKLAHIGKYRGRRTLKGKKFADPRELLVEREGVGR